MNYVAQHRKIAQCFLFGITIALAVALGARADTNSSLLVNESFVASASLDTYRATIKNGGDVNARGQDDRTPLHYAIRYGSPAMVQLLIANGANVKLGNKYENTPLHWSVHLWDGESKQDALSKTQMLLAAGAEVDALTIKNETPLMFASTPEIAVELLQAGADSSIKDDQGKTPAAYAQVDGRMDVADTIFQKSATENSEVTSKNTSPPISADVSNFAVLNVGKVFSGKYEGDDASSVEVTFIDPQTIRVVDSGNSFSGPWHCDGVARQVDVKQDTTTYAFKLTPGSESTSFCAADEIIRLSANKAESTITMVVEYDAAHQINAELVPASKMATFSAVKEVAKRLQSADQGVLRLTPETTGFTDFLSLLLLSGKNLDDLAHGISLPETGNQFQDRRARKSFEDDLAARNADISARYAGVEFIVEGITPVLMDYDFDRNVQKLCVPNEMLINQEFSMLTVPVLQFAWNGKADVIGGCGVSGGGASYANGNRIESGRVLDIPLPSVDAGEAFNNKVQAEGMVLRFLCTNPTLHGNVTLACVPSAIEVSSRSGEVLFARVYAMGQWVNEIP